LQELQAAGSCLDRKPTQAVDLEIQLEAGTAAVASLDGRLGAAVGWQRDRAHPATAVLLHAVDPAKSPPALPRSLAAGDTDPLLDVLLEVAAELVVEVALDRRS
jgi:hypothetical protein